MKAKLLTLGGLLALPGLLPAQTPDAHSHGEVRSAQVQAALDAAAARVPRARYEALKETRVPRVGKRAAGTLLELGSALQQSVVVVLDADGTAHTECVEGAAPHEAQP